VTAPTTPEEALARDEALARKWTPKVRTQFRREGRRVIRRNGRGGVREREWHSLLSDLWVDTGREVFDAEYEKLTGSKPEARQKQQLVALVLRIIRDGRGAEQIATFVDEASKGIVTTTRKRIGTILRRVGGRPSNIREVNRALRRLYNTNFVAKRANRIALDQVMRATATYEHAAALFAQEVTGREYVQIWRNQGDSRVRESHTSVEPVALGENFKVGGYELRYPRDPAGPASETYGCRCWTERQRV
jgi:hypothetical protein